MGMSRLRRYMATVLAGPGGVGAVSPYQFDVTAFTQSLGAANANYDLSTWTAANNLANWTESAVGADPGISEVAPDGGAGTGAARFVSSATNLRPYIVQIGTVTLNDLYEVEINLTARTSGTLRADMVGPDLTSAVRRNTIGRALDTSYYVTARNAPSDFVVDTAKYQKVTLNAVQTALADADIRFGFTLPASPLAGQLVELWYRMPAGAVYVDGFRMRLMRNAGNTAWDLYLDKYVTGTDTNFLTITGVGTPNALRVTTTGQTHQLYTGEAGIDGAWTPRGAPQSSTNHTTATQAQVLYCSAFTASRFRGSAYSPF